MRRGGSHIQQGTWVASQLGFSIPFPVQGPAAGQLANCGNSWHEGTQWNMPSVQGAPPACSETLLPSEQRECVCARPIAGALQLLTQRTNLHSALLGGYQDPPSSNEEVEAHRVLATHLGQPGKEASELRASTDLPHTGF